MTNMKTLMFTTVAALCLTSGSVYAEGNAPSQKIAQYREYRAPMSSTNQTAENWQYQNRQGNQTDRQDQYPTNRDTTTRNTDDHRGYGPYNTPQGNAASYMRQENRAYPPASLSARQLQQVQRRLRDEGYAVSVDGVWGRQTVRALRDFQRDKNLEVTGSLNQRTLAALNISNANNRTHQGNAASYMRQENRAYPPANLSARQLQQVQKRLRDEGYAVSVDGVWGRQTARALRDFQRDKNLEVTGSLDQRTLSALNMSNTTNR